MAKTKPTLIKIGKHYFDPKSVAGIKQDVEKALEHFNVLGTDGEDA